MVKVVISVIELDGKYYRIIRGAGTTSLIKAGKIIYSIEREFLDINKLDEEMRQEMRKRGIKHVVNLGDC